MIDPFAERETHEAEVVEPEDMLRSLAKVEESADAVVHRELSSVEDNIYRRHSEIVDAIADWPDFDPEAPEPVEPVARRRYRVAAAANLPKSKAPIGITASIAVHGAILKARASKPQAPETNHLVIVALPVPAKIYERKLVKADGR